MCEGSVVINIAIDQGGCFATSNHIATHDSQTYTNRSVIHYAVANMLSAMSRTATMILSNATLSYAKTLADKGHSQACLDNPVLLKGINTLQSYVTHKAVTELLSYEFVSAQSLLTG